MSTLKSSSIIPDTGLIPTLRAPLLNREEAKRSSQSGNFYHEKVYVWIGRVETNIVYHI